MILGISALGKKKIFIIFASSKFLSLKIFQNPADYRFEKPLALSIGMFDGVHLGHQEVISRLNKIAEAKGLESAVLTFWPHPRTIFTPDDDLHLLNTLDEKLNLLEKAGVQNVVLQEFNEDFRCLNGDEFISQFLVKKLGTKHVIIGYDHKFGKSQSGNFQLLKQMEAECGYTADKTEAVYCGTEIVSSTKIRKALTEGDIQKANEMLGYRYQLSGEVVHGNKLGRIIGYPTANLQVDANKLLPKNGAYIVRTFVEGVSRVGMMSIMTNPTFGGSELRIEVNILDFAGDLYGKNLKVEIYERLHDEINFESVEKLIVQLDEDKRLTQKFFGAGLRDV